MLRLYGRDCPDTAEVVTKGQRKKKKKGVHWCSSDAGSHGRGKYLTPELD